MTTNSEEWRPIPGYEGRYEVSDFGRVRSFYRRPRILAGSKQDGYILVALCRDGTRRTCGVHRIVLFAFVGPPPPKHECAHWDGDPSNNRLGNLRWATKKDNIVDSRRLMERPLGSKMPAAKLTEQDIPKIRGDGQQMRQIADEYGVSLNTISQIKMNKAWKHVP